MSGEKIGSLSGLSERGTPSFAPYPQSLPTAHLLKKDGSSDGSAKEGSVGSSGQAIGTGGQQIRKKSRRPSESAAVLCQHCGKNYKHQQCLVKHLWEHSPYWSSIPDTQPLSKHQRVQLLEGASILYRLSGSPGGAGGTGDGTAVFGAPSSSLPEGGSLTASGFAGPPGISPSPFGTSISRSGIVDTKAGIILEDDDDDENVIASDDDDDEDDPSSPPISSSAMDEDDDRAGQDDEPELFGTMEQ